MLDIPVAYLVIVKCCGRWGTTPWRLLEPQTWLVMEATIPLYIPKTTKRKYNLVLECSPSCFVRDLSVTSRRTVDVHLFQFTLWADCVGFRDTVVFTVRHNSRFID